MRYPSNSDRDREDWDNASDDWPAWDDASDHASRTPFADAMRDLDAKYHTMQLAYVDELVADGALADTRAERLLRWLIAQDAAHVRYDARTHSGHYRGTWRETAVFCRMAGEDGASDHDPHSFGGRRW